jgi:phage terminase large subunit
LSEAEALIPKAFRELFQPSRYKAYHGGRGSAKSHSVAAALVIKSMQRKMRIVCAREIQKSIRESVKELIESKIAALGYSQHFECLDYETRCKLTGSVFIYIGMWRNPTAVKSLEGADLFWGEEASAFSAKSLKIIRPTVRAPGSELWFTWNPEYDHDPIEKLFRGKDGPPPGSIVREVSHKDNPWFDQTPLRADMEYDYEHDPDSAEHVWGGEYVKAVEGAYFTKQLRKAREDGRIGSVVEDPILAKRAFWDIGGPGKKSDAMAVWVAQFVDQEIKVLFYLEGQGQTLGYYTTELINRGCEKALMVVPHDAAQTHADNLTGLDFEAQLKKAGFKTEIVTNQGPGAVMQRIDAVRKIFPRIWINEDECRAGLKALGHYHERRDEERNAGLGPEHDWSSHGADAFGLMCISYKPPSNSWSKPIAYRDARAIV